MLRITQNNAQIGIQTMRGELNIRSKLPELSIHQEHAKVQINTELPRVHIDQYQCFAEAGLKNNMDLLKEFTQLAAQHVMEYIAKTAQDGDTLAAIERGGNPIADIAERDAYPEKQFVFDSMPKSRPKIEVTGDVKIDFKPGGVDFSAESGQVNINTTRSEVKIYLRQRPSIQFEYVGKNVDTRI